MTRRFLGIALAFLLMIPAFITSCGDDDNGTTGPGNEETAEIPDIPETEITQSVDFQSDDPAAQQAEGYVQTMLGATTAITASANQLTASLDDASWTGSGSDCWTWSATYEGCNATYRVCESTETYDWTLTMNGTCGEGGDPVDNWVSFSGSTSKDATSGTFRWFEPYTTTVGGAWAWTLSADHKTGSWTFYNGDVSESNLVATLDWTENTDGSEDVIWLMPETMKWTLHVEQGGTAGSMQTFTWDASSQDWLLQAQITWTFSGGAMTFYNPDGSVQSADTWGTGV